MSRRSSEARQKLIAAPLHHDATAGSYFMPSPPHRKSCFRAHHLAIPVDENIIRRFKPINMKALDFYSADDAVI